MKHLFLLIALFSIASPTDAIADRFTDTIFMDSSSDTYKGKNYQEDNIIDLKTYRKVEKDIENLPSKLSDEDTELLRTQKVRDLAIKEFKKGPTSVCPNGHRWICFENSFKNNIFKTTPYGKCSKPSGEETCFQAY